MKDKTRYKCPAHADQHASVSYNPNTKSCFCHTCLKFVDYEQVKALNPDLDDARESQ